MEVVSVVEGDGVDAADVFDGAEGSRDPEEGVALGETEEDVIQAQVRGAFLKRFNEVSGGVFVAGLEMSDVRVVERGVR
ncbi:MAG: hypothetical protein ACXW31_15070, partial [Thermoanaerobaculia bacterium]